MEKENIEEDYFQLCFTVLKKVPFGKSLYICGSYISLGIWNPQRALKMEWTEGHYWHVKMPYKEIKNKVNFEYKYFISDEKITKNSLIRWENNQNRTIKYYIDNNFFFHIEVIYSLLNQGHLGKIQNLL